MIAVKGSPGTHGRKLDNHLQMTADAAELTDQVSHHLDRLTEQRKSGLVGVVVDALGGSLVRIHGLPDPPGAFAVTHAVTDDHD
jgi:hypothetical protein